MAQSRASIWPVGLVSVGAGSGVSKGVRRCILGKKKRRWARVSEIAQCSIVESIEGRSVGDEGCKGGGCGRAGWLENGVVANAINAAKGAEKGSDGAMEVEFVGEGE